RPLVEGVRRSVVAYRDASTGRRRYGNGIPRTDYDAPLLWVLVPFGLVLVPMALIYHAVVRDGIVALVMTVLMAGAAFLFSAGAGPAAGQVRDRRGDSGSSPPLERAAGYAHGQPGARRVRGHASVGVGRLGRGHQYRRPPSGPAAGGVRL